MFPTLNLTTPYQDAMVRCIGAEANARGAEAALEASEEALAAAVGEAAELRQILESMKGKHAGVEKSGQLAIEEMREKIDDYEDELEEAEEKNVALTRTNEALQVCFFFFLCS